MGYTKFTTELIKKHLSGVKSVIDLGSQNLYIDVNNPYPPFVSEWYKEQGIDDYECIDLAGDNNAWKIDLSKPFENTDYLSWHGRHIGTGGWDLVVDAGTSEHCVQMEAYESVAFHDGHINSIYPKGEVKNIELGYYNCWLNKHNLCKIGGLMISENPKTGHWPDHGYSYIDRPFYIRLSALVGYESLELGEHAAMGNFESGINIYSVLRKKTNDFISFEKFSMLSIYKN